MLLERVESCAVQTLQITLLVYPLFRFLWHKRLSSNMQYKYWIYRSKTVSCTGNFLADKLFVFCFLSYRNSAMHFYLGTNANGHVFIEQRVYFLILTMQSHFPYPVNSFIGQFVLRSFVWLVSMLVRCGKGNDEFRATQSSTSMFQGPFCVCCL